MSHDATMPRSHLNRLSNLPSCQMTCMADFAVSVLEPLLTLVARVLFYTSVHMQCSSSDLLRMHCYATLVVLHLSTHPVT